MKFYITVRVGIFCSIIWTVKSTQAGASGNGKCGQTLTTASGKLVKENGIICPGDLIFEDNFDFLDFEKWQHENTLAGGGNWEFQWYTNNRSNSFTKDGSLHIRPTLTADLYGEAYLNSGSLNINGGAPADACTNPLYWGCERLGTPSNILNPIRSARLRSIDSFNFKFGKVEVKAKLPSGDWLWPAIWLMPKHNAYGSWPASGEIDIVESRGNKNLVKNGVNIGAEQIGSTLHFGPYPAVNAYQRSHYHKNSKPGSSYSDDYHRYQLEWTPEKIVFSVDDEEIGTVPVGQGMWTRGGFNTIPGISNPWKYGTALAPFDQEFYLIINLAVGGVSYFPDDAENPGGKPWSNESPTALTDFWNSRNLWLPTWRLHEKNGQDASLLVDYVRVYAI